MCHFCNEQNVRELLIQESRHSLVICNRFPITSNGHFLIIPKRHVIDLFDLSFGETIDISILGILFLRKVKYRINPTGINILYNDGEVAGQTAPHIHLHVIIREPDDGIANFRREDGQRPEILTNDLLQFQNSLK